MHDLQRLRNDGDTQEGGRRQRKKTMGKKMEKEWREKMEKEME